MTFPTHECLVHAKYRVVRSPASGKLERNIFESTTISFITQHAQDTIPKAFTGVVHAITRSVVDASGNCKGKPLSRRLQHSLLPALLPRIP